MRCPPPPNWAANSATSRMGLPCSSGIDRNETLTRPGETSVHNNETPHPRTDNGSLTTPARTSAPAPAARKSSWDKPVSAICPSAIHSNRPSAVPIKDSRAGCCAPSVAWYKRSRRAPASIKVPAKAKAPASALACRNHPVSVANPSKSGSANS